MGDLDEFPLKWRLFLSTYRWRRIDPVPWAELRKPLREAKVALVSSAGFVLPDQAAFDPDVRGGDSSFRVVPSTTEAAALVNTHRSELFDPAGIAEDQNIAFPLDRMRELGTAGEIGGTTSRAISFMGSITATATLVNDTAPQIATILEQDGAEAALLVPI